MPELATSPAPPERSWARRWLAAVNHRFEPAPPEALLGWAVESFAPNLCLATSFGPQSIVLMHMLAGIHRETTVFYLDTGLLFEETYALIDELRRRLGVEVVRVAPELSVGEQAARHGPELWARDPDRCCRLRKVLPLRRFLASREAWITGLRRTQSAHRALTALVEWDPGNSLIKINPLAGWSADRVWDYVALHGLPTNPLHRQGYPSIGCRPCTRAVLPGEGPRAGRWPSFAKTECGIHGGLLRVGPGRSERSAR